MEKKKKRLGEVLVENGLIDVYQLQSALAHQKQWGGKLGEILVKLGFLTEEELMSFLSHHFHLPYANLRKIAVPPSVIKIVSEDVARKYNILPLVVKEEIGRKNLYLAMSDPTNVVVIDELQFALGMPVRPVLAPDNIIAEAIEFYYAGRGTFRPDPDAVSTTKLNFSLLVRKTHKEGGKVEPVAEKGEAPDKSTIFIFTDDEEKVMNIDEIDAGSEAHAEEHIPEGMGSDATKTAPTVSPDVTKLYAALQDINYKLNALAKLLIRKGIITKDEYLLMYRQEKSRRSQK